MSKSLTSQSPRNIRSINLAIAEGILRALKDSVNGMGEDLLKSKGLENAAKLDENIEKLTTQGDETIMELRRLGLVDRKKMGKTNVYVLCSDGEAAISGMDKVGREKYFFESLYEKEPLFKQFIDMLQRRGKLTDSEAMQISGINLVKISFIKSILQQMPSVARPYRDGRKTYIQYAKREVISPSEIRKTIVRDYYALQGSRLFVAIDELWKNLRAKHPEVPEELFDKVVLDLANDHVGRVELVQGVSSPQAKLLFDNRSGTYFHYLKIPKYILDDELKNG